MSGIAFKKIKQQWQNSNPLLYLVREEITCCIETEKTTFSQQENEMRNEFAALVEHDDGWCIACSPEVPGADRQGRTNQEAMKSLSDAIALVLEERRADGLRRIPENALKVTVSVE
jgi:predicted RNase H-like HicB family nuclease